MQEKRKLFFETISKIDPQQVVALDESSINLAYFREYGRSQKGRRIREGCKDVRFERKSIISTIRLNGDVAPLVFPGTLNDELCAEYIRKVLKPTLKKNDILLLDNSSVHKSKLVREVLAECGITTLFLPPYSPDFNPIELFWAYMKKKLRTIKARTHEALNDGIKDVFSSLPISNIYNWFKHCNMIVDIK